MTIRVALLGRGMAGTVFHAPLIRAVAGMELAAIAGASDAAATAAAPDVDLVVIATPNFSHFPLAAAALEAGKHVVVDKPFTVTVEEADALIELARDRGLILTVFQNRRWDGDFLTVRQMIESGRLGELSLYEAYWDRFRPTIKRGWRELPAEGAGLFWDLGPHLIDQALLLFGRPDAVSADIAIQRLEALVDDYFALTLHYGRMRAVLSASTLMLHPRPRFAVSGDRGSYFKRGLDAQEAALKARTPPIQPDFGQEESPFHGTLTNPDGTTESIPTTPGRYLAFYEAVLRSITEGAAAPVDPADARDGLRLIELARQSAAEGRRLSFSADSRAAIPAPAAE